MCKRTVFFLFRLWRRKRINPIVRSRASETKKRTFLVWCIINFHIKAPACMQAMQKYFFIVALRAR